VLRRIIGQPQFAIVILTISLGFMFRSGCRLSSGGHETQVLRDPRSPTASSSSASLILPLESISMIAGTVILPARSISSSTSPSRQCHAGLLAEPAGGLLHGHPVKRINSLIWAISAIVATIAGVLLSPVSLVDPSIGFLGIKAFAAAVIGGFGSLLGTVLGGLIVGISETLVGRYLPPGFKEIFAYLIMLAVLLVRPQGLFSTMQRKKV
jgi:branched-chain amino acid transport system permease protein